MTPKSFNLFFYHGEIFMLVIVFYFQGFAPLPVYSLVPRTGSIFVQVTLYVVIIVFTCVLHSLR